MRDPVALAFALTVALASGCADEELVIIPDPPPEPEIVDEDPEDPVPPIDSGSDCATDSDCGAGSECEAGICVGVGVLQITLTFNMDTDLDLHVLTPSGEEIYFGTPEVAGGVLDVDTCIGECDPGVHVENVFFNDALEGGFYSAYVVNFDGRAGGPFHLEVSGAAQLTLDGTIDGVQGMQSEQLAFFLTTDGTEE